MKKTRYNLILILSILSILSAGTYACGETTYNELNTPKPPIYRLGSGSEPELEYKVIDKVEEQKAKHIREHVKNKSYADSTLKDLSKEIGQSLDAEKETMLEDISILWAGAAAKSETVKFTIYKLSNPDADKPDENMIKKVIRPLAGFTSMAGAGFLNPIAATTAIMSGALVNSMSTGDKDLNYKYTKVTDADMIMLLKRVDELQKKLINDYLGYMCSLRASETAAKAVNNRYSYVLKSRNASREQILIADAYYRTALENKKRAELEFLSKRAALEQTVGMDAMNEFESNLITRKSQK